MVEKIISGGQTGADRAALDFALAHGLPHGGWCPLGRLAEDGVIPARYELEETSLPDYAQRTAWNVRHADGTVIFSLARELSGGSRFTAEIAGHLGKPCLHLSRDAEPANAAATLRAFVSRHQIKCLNVAGPRASSEPAVGEFVRQTLETARCAMETQTNPSVEKR